MVPALLTAIDSTSHVHLIVGSNPLAGARCNRSIEVGAKVTLVAPADATLHYGLMKRIDEGQVNWTERGFRDEDLTTLGRDEVDHVVDAVFVTLGGKHPLSMQREIASSLPSSLGTSVERLGTIRRRIWEEDHAAELSMDLEAEEDDVGQTASFNKLITPEDVEAARNRRMRWLAQICEYWPLRRLASITDADVETVLRSYTMSDAPALDPGAIDKRRRKGRIILAGSGPGNPDLLTRATHKAILCADLILADKLVPAPVLELVPRRTTVYIARKFPGNAEKAQEELLSMGLEGLKAGKTVVRLKQGDPYIYGRGAEEYAFFREHGWTPTVLPGITSALSAPLFAAIPATHRAVSDQVLICTGTGRKGAAPDPPAYLPNQTVVFLMSLHRLSALVDSLHTKEKAWPLETPCAVLERASCPDQRVIRTTL
ncbi:hypothetical protein LTR04_002088, partial [Oleoguttula sp. CCFEE 6159]